MSLIANNNQKPAWKLVFKALKANRFRTFCILFAICTCTFVMTFLPCVNTLDYLNTYEDFSGEEHAVFTSLTEEELLIETSQMEGFASITDRGVTVVLDTRLTPELIEEGFVREIISKIQSMRRDADFDVTDHIAVTMEGSEKVCEIAQTYVDAISRDVLADSLTVGKAEGVVSQWDINGEDAVFGVAKISK